MDPLEKVGYGLDPGQVNIQIIMKSQHTFNVANTITIDTILIFNFNNFDQAMLIK